VADSIICDPFKRRALYPKKFVTYLPPSPGVKVLEIFDIDFGVLSGLVILDRNGLEEIFKK
jgi:hypothetical protein